MRAGAASRGATPDTGSVNSGTLRRHVGHVAGPEHKSARVGFAGANHAGGVGEEGQMMNVDLVGPLSFVELLGGVLTMPGAVLVATALVCTVFLMYGGGDEQS